MVAVAAQVLNFNGRVGKSFLDQPFNFVRFHRHSVYLVQFFKNGHESIGFKAIGNLFYAECKALYNM